MTEYLERLSRRAKSEILYYLGKHGLATDKELVTHIVNILSMHTKKDGTLIRFTSSIFLLSYIMAYKELETENKITIQRPYGTSFPMIDFETTFQLVKA